MATQLRQEQFEADPAFRADVLSGLARSQKAIPARWFYDDRGSQLFDDITRLPEYYPTRAETEILAAYGQDLGRAIGPGRAVVEFGAGSATKTPLLLRCITPSAYVPIDISGDFLRAACQPLAAQFPDLAILPIEADFTRPLTLPTGIGSAALLGFFPGSTIGNFTPHAATDLLRAMRDTLGDSALLVIGFDRIKDPATLIAAYDDSAGVTAAFNLNLAARINRELDGTMPLDGLRHRARWNEGRARIEMHLEASRDLAFSVCGRRFAMQRGETIHTENSHKYDPRSAATLLLGGGWAELATYADAGEQFMVMLARALPVEAAP